MRIQVAVPDEHVTPEVVEPVLEAVTRLNEHMIRTGQSPTSHDLLQMGAIWRPENMGDEHFDHGGTIAQRGWGDCDDWAPLRAATLRATGEDPHAVSRIVQSGPTTYHAMVQRGTGELERGDQDISVQAGMRPSAAISGADGQMMAYICDPHDGRIYQGSLLPTVAPLSIHCGPQMSVRGCTVIGHGQLWEARVDVPIEGSRLVHVHAYDRHRPHHHRRRRIHGMLPLAMSLSHLAPTRLGAIQGALCGAVLAADACGMSTTLDRYKLLCAQSAASGMHPHDVAQALVAHLFADVQATAAAGCNPADMMGGLLAELGKGSTGDYAADVQQIARGVMHACFPSRGKDGRPRRRPAGAKVVGAAGSDTLHPGESLSPGQGIKAAGVSVDMQQDGNFVVYDRRSGQPRPMWASATQGKGGVVATMQTDGNLVVYNAQKKPLWASATQGHPGAYAVVQNDGNFVVYGTDHKPLWASATQDFTQHPPHGGFDLGSALGDAWHAVQSGVGSVVDVANKLHIPGVNLTTALITGKPLGQALQDDLHSFASAANIAQHVASGNTAALADDLQKGAASFGVNLPPQAVQAATQLAQSASQGGGIDPATIAATALGPHYSDAWKVATNAGHVLAALPTPGGTGYHPTAGNPLAALTHPLTLAANKEPIHITLPVKPLAVPVDHVAIANAAADKAATAPPPAATVDVPSAVKPPGVAHAAMPVHPSIEPHPTAAQAPALVMPPAAARPGIPPGATHWHCQPLPGGQWACSWQ